MVCDWLTPAPVKSGERLPASKHPVRFQTRARARGQPVRCAFAAANPERAPGARLPFCINNANRMGCRQYLHKKVHRPHRCSAIRNCAACASRLQPHRCGHVRKSPSPRQARVQSKQIGRSVMGLRASDDGWPGRAQPVPDRTRFSRSRQKHWLASRAKRSSASPASPLQRIMRRG